MPESTSKPPADAVFRRSGRCASPRRTLPTAETRLTAVQSGHCGPVSSDVRHSGTHLHGFRIMVILSNMSGNLLALRVGFSRENQRWNRKRRSESRMRLKSSWGGKFEPRSSATPISTASGVSSCRSMFPRQTDLSTNGQESLGNEVIRYTTGNVYLNGAFQQ